MIATVSNVWWTCLHREVVEIANACKKNQVASEEIKSLVMQCNGNCPCQNFRCKNSFKSDVALKHAQGERPARKAFQKSRNRRPRRTNARDDRKDVYSVCRTRYCAHPREIDTTIVTKTSVPDACLNIPAMSCVVTSASAGSRGQYPLNDSNC